MGYENYDYKWVINYNYGIINGLLTITMIINGLTMGH